MTAQLSSSARFARGAAFSALGAAFTLRAVGDASGTEGGVLSWLSPLGWSLQVRPFAGAAGGLEGCHQVLLVLLGAAPHEGLLRPAHDDVHVTALRTRGVPPHLSRTRTLAAAAWGPRDGRGV